MGCVNYSIPSPTLFMIKKHFCFSFLFSFIHVFGFSQKLEIGIGAGPTYYKGDLQPTFRVFSPRVGTNAFVRYNFSKMLSVKANSMIGIVGGRDDQSGNVLNKDRDFSFSNKLWEYNGQLEYNFLNFRTHNGRYESNWTPYLFGGYGMYTLLSRKYKNPGAEMLIGKKISANAFLPFGIGFKKIYRGKWNFGAEFGTRVLLNKNAGDRFDGFWYEESTTSKLGYYTENVLTKIEHKYPNTLQKDKYFYVNFSVSYLFYKVHCPPNR
jgi:Domain of unknown function (DUF6089)